MNPKATFEEKVDEYADAVELLGQDIVDAFLKLDKERQLNLIATLEEELELSAE